MRRSSLEISARASSRASSRSRDPRGPTRLRPSSRVPTECPRPRRRRARAAPRTLTPPLPAPHAGRAHRGHEWGDVPARLRARFAAAHGLDGVRFRPFGEALLDAEDRAGTPRAPAPPLARRDDAGWPDDAPAGDAAAGLLLGRLKSNKYSIPDDLGASDDGDDDANASDLDLLDALPRGRRSDRRIPPARHPAKSAIHADPRRAPRAPLALRALPRRAPRRGGPRRGVVRGRRAGGVVLGGVVRARFTAPEPVRQALWCRFPERNSAEECDVDQSGFDGVGIVSDDASDEPVLCLRHAASMTTYGPSGASLAVPLPPTSSATRAPPPSVCCCPPEERIRRASPARRTVPDRPRGRRLGRRLRRRGNRARPRRTDPNPDADAIAIVSIDATSIVGVRGPPAPNDRIVWSSAESLFVLTHDASLRAHSLWRLAPAADSDAFAAFAPVRRRHESRRGATPGAPPDTPRDGHARGDVEIVAGARECTLEPRVRRDALERRTVTGVVREGLDRTRRFRARTGDVRRRDARRRRRADARDAPRRRVDRVRARASRRRARDGDGDRPDGRGRGPPRVSFAIEGVAAAVAVAATRARSSTSSSRDAVLAPPAPVSNSSAARERAHAWDADAFLLADEDEPSPRVGSVVRLHSPVGPRFTAETAEGVAARLAAPTAPQDPAAAALTRAVDATFEGDERAEAMAIVSAASARAVAARRPSRHPRARTGRHGRVERRRGALLGWCGCEALADRVASSRDEDETRARESRRARRR